MLRFLKSIFKWRKMVILTPITAIWAEKKHYHNIEKRPFFPSGLVYICSGIISACQGGEWS
jgi:nucleoside diphosphate kinase